MSLAPWIRLARVLTVGNRVEQVRGAVGDEGTGAPCAVVVRVSKLQAPNTGTIEVTLRQYGTTHSHGYQRRDSTDDLRGGHPLCGCT